MKLILETERLRLRPFSVDDAQAMYEGWTSDPEVAHYVTWPVHENVDVTRSLLEMWAKEYEKPERLNFAIELKDSGELIGGIDVVGYLDGVNGTPVIGYNLSRKHWGKGYMTEACRYLLGYLFSKGYEQVRIDALPENERSIRVIKKCGGEYIRTDEDVNPFTWEKMIVNRYVVRKENE